MSLILPTAPAQQANHVDIGARNQQRAGFVMRVEPTFVSGDYAFTGELNLGTTPIQTPTGELPRQAGKLYAGQTRGFRVGADITPTGIHPGIGYFVPLATTPLREQVQGAAVLTYTAENGLHNVLDMRREIGRGFSIDYDHILGRESYVGEIRFTQDINLPSTGELEAQIIRHIAKNKQDGWSIGVKKRF